MRRVALFAFLILLAPCSWAQQESALHFGVLAVRPEDISEKQWQPLAKYLEAALGRRVEVTAYGFPQLEKAIDGNRVDVVLTNSGHYVQLKHKRALSAPLAMRIAIENGREITAYGGVIITAADRSDIASLADLPGKTVASTDTKAFGGYSMQSFELLEAGLPVPEPRHLITTGMPHDRVVEAVLGGKADIGFVRAGDLEAMIREGKLNPERIKIINRQPFPGYPYINSTRLYPEWPIAVMPSVDEVLARRLTVALLSLPAESEAATSAGIPGFTIPADYSGVEQVLRSLRQPPFDAPPEFTLADLWKRYGEWIAMLTGVSLMLVVAVFRLQIQNRRIAQARQRFATLFESSPEPLCILIGGNKAALDSLGISETSQIEGRTPSDFSSSFQSDGESSAAKCQRLITAAAAAEQQVEWDFQTASGERLTAEVTLTPTELEGKPALLCAWHDITARKRTETRLQLAASVFSHAREGILITDAEGRIVEVNRAFTRITGYSHDEAIGQNPRMLKSGRQPPDFYDDMWKSLAEKGHWSGEIWNRRKNGEVYAEMLTITTIRNKHGNPKNFVALFSDITSIKEHQKQLEYIAHYDALTNLPNRMLLADRLRHAMALNQRHGLYLAVVYIDLDGFKQINDSHGHDTGDQMLISVAKRMRSTLREGDTLARIGGDEFVAVITDLTTPEDCSPMLLRLLQAASLPSIWNKSSSPCPPASA
jgi:diguanylate cyclase (GGDEF)-like protein/PAS domain S-box-containing protein